MSPLELWREAGERVESFSLEPGVSLHTAGPGFPTSTSGIRLPLKSLPATRPLSSSPYGLCPVQVSGMAGVSRPTERPAVPGQRRWRVLVFKILMAQACPPPFSWHTRGCLGSAQMPGVGLFSSPRHRTWARLGFCVLLGWERSFHSEFANMYVVIGMNDGKETDIREFQKALGRVTGLGSSCTIQMEPGAAQCPQVKMSSGCSLLRTYT